MIVHYDVERKEQSLVERWELWKRALCVIQARPLTGTGINTYDRAHARYDTHQNWRVKGYYAHNGYLQTAAEIGIPGLLCFLFFIWFYFKKSLQLIGSRQHAPPEFLTAGLLAGIFNFLILSGIDTVLHNQQSVMFFWFLLGLQWAYQERIERSC